MTNMDNQPDGRKFGKRTGQKMQNQEGIDDQIEMDLFSPNFNLGQSTVRPNCLSSKPLWD